MAVISVSLPLPGLRQGVSSSDRLSKASSTGAKKVHLLALSPVSLSRAWWCRIESNELYMSMSYPCGRVAASVKRLIGYFRTYQDDRVCLLDALSDDGEGAVAADGFPDGDRGDAFEGQQQQEQGQEAACG